MPPIDKAVASLRVALELGRKISALEDAQHRGNVGRVEGLGNRRETAADSLAPLIAISTRRFFKPVLGSV